MSETVKLSLIVPCYNEESNVEKFYETVYDIFGGKIDSYEIIFVDDGSKDKTYQKLKELYETHKESNIKVLRFSRNFGKEAAMYAGLKAVEGEYACIIDADLQQSPAVVIEMLEILEKEPVDCVAAYQKNRHESKTLIFFKNMFYKLINKVTDVEFYAGASDFRTFRKEVVDAIVQLPEKFRFSKGIFSWVGFDTKFIEYEVQERFSGTSKWSFRKLFKYAIDGMIAFTTTPLKIATFIGGVLSGISLLYFLWVFIQTLVFGIDLPGYATLVCLILLLGGVQLIMLGIIGEYLGRIYIEGKNRPIYLLKDFLTYKDKNVDEQTYEKHEVK